jgi:hypothetical protein
MLKSRRHCILSIVWYATVVGCSTGHFKPCTEGGQPPRENGSIIPGSIKRCYQQVNGDGVLVNHGKYFEWYSNDQLAVSGEYEMGKKTGRWIEYNTDGKKTSDQYFKDGKPVERP